MEGGAHYVEHQMTSRWKTFADTSVLKGYPDFQSYKSFKDESKELWCRQIGSYSHLYIYDQGFAYALILDRRMSRWKSTPPDPALFFDGYFANLGFRI